MPLKRSFLYVALAMSIGVRCVNIMMHAPTDFVITDPARHWEFGTQPLSENPFTAIDPIGYQLWLSIVGKITMGDRAAIIAYSILLTCTTLWVWYRFVLEVSHDGLLSLWVAALTSWLPDTITIYSYYMIESVLLPIVGIACWTTWKAARSTTWESRIWPIVLWTVSCLFKLAAFPLAVVAIAYLLISQRDRRFKTLAVGGVCMLCLCLPVAYRSKLLLNVWSPFGLTAMNQVYWESEARHVDLDIFSERSEQLWGYSFTTPTVDEKPFAPLSNWTSTRSGRVYVSVRTAQGLTDWTKALAAHRPGTARLLRLWRENLIFLFWGKAWPAYHFERLWESLGLASRWIWMPLVVWVLYLTVRNRNAPPLDLLLPVMTLVTWAAFVVLPSAPMEGRYRLILEPLTVIAAIYGWHVKAQREVSQRLSNQVGGSS